MSKYIKRAILALSIVVILVIATISTFFIVRYFENKSKIDNVLEVYSDNVIQNLEDAEASNMEDNLLQIDGETVLGVVEIDKINYKGLVYEGTSLDTLAKGVGHFEISAYFEGNVCLAAHNYNQVWGKLYTLQTGDTITYNSFLGTKDYQVCSIKEIEETDWTMLEDTDDNRITLITCVYNKPNLRLCVQATEII